MSGGPLPDPVTTRRVRAGRGVRSIYGLLVALLALAVLWIAVKPYIYTATPGTVTAPRYVISTPYVSRVTEVYVEPGARVWEGQRVATVRSPEIYALKASLVTGLADQTNVQAELKIRLSVAQGSLPSARQRVERSRQNLDRMGRLSCPASSNFCSDIFREHALATGVVAQLEAEVQELRTQIDEVTKARKDIADLNDTVARAYADGHQISWVTGIVGPRIVQPGQSVSAGDAILTVYDDRKRQIEWVLDGARIRQPQVGDRVYVMDGSHALRGRVSEVLGIADLAARSQSLFEAPMTGQVVHVKLDDGEPYPPLLSTVEVRYNYWRSQDAAVELFCNIMEALGLWRSK